MPATDQKIINHLKGLVLDGVDRAQSGHPGGAMSSMDFAAILFRHYLRFDPKDPQWLGRDRFILSAGHESMLQYALLYGLDWLEKEDLQNFRQLDSRTPGHPENTETPGVECTTGPLGQGCAMSVGFAIAARHFRAKFSSEIFSTKTYVLMGDGCMQEGVTLGAASYAGHLGLSDLIWYFDRNDIQISGQCSRATSDDHARVFEGLGWNVLTIDGHDHEAIHGAIRVAKTSIDKPTLIIGETTIAKGAASVEGSHKTHGAPLAKTELEATKRKLGIPEGQCFHWPADVSEAFQSRHQELTDLVADWQQSLANKQSESSFRSAFAQHFDGKAPSLSQLSWEEAPVATRNAFGRLLEAWCTEEPRLVGGSADLEPSNMTGAFAGIVGDFQKDTPEGRNYAFGVREFPMSAVCNGLALFGGLMPFDATFLSFADYSRPALRLGCLQRAHVIHEFSHDSIYLGEDGPTHQPIEHLMSLRLMPKMYVMRPADGLETEECLRLALSRPIQSSHCLTRQKLPRLPATEKEVRGGTVRGGWIVKREQDGDLRCVVFATGSEVHLALEAIALMGEEGKQIRIISMPCWEIFAEQETAYQNDVLAWHCPKRVSVEAGASLGWERFIGPGLSIGIDSFGKSAPAAALADDYGFTPSQLRDKITSYLGR